MLRFDSKSAATAAARACALGAATLLAPIWGIGAAESGGPGALPRVDSLRVHRYNVDDGLSQSSVLAILVDRHGFVWLGTQQGLDRFDGYDFLSFRARPGVEGALQEDSVSTLLESESGDIWVGSSRGGLSRLHPDTFVVEPFVHDPDNQLSLPDGSVRALLKDRGGRIWVAASGGLAYTAGDGRFEHASSASCLSLFENAAGELLVGTSTGVLVRGVDGGELARRERLAALEKWPVSAIAGSERETWYATQGGGLFRENAGVLRRFAHVVGDPGSPPGDYLLSLLASPDGTVWAGARNGGLGRLRPGELGFSTFRHRPNEPFSLAEDDVSALALDGHDGLWIGAWNGGVSRADLRAQAFRSILHDPLDASTIADNDVTATFVDSRENLFVGGRNGMLDVRPRGRKGFERVGGSAASGLGSVRAIREDGRGRVWVATTTGLYPVAASEAGTFAVGSSVVDTGARVHDVLALGRTIYYLVDGGLGHSRAGSPARIVLDAAEAAERGAFQRLLLEDDEHLWIGTSGHGALALTLGPAGELVRVEKVDRSRGLSDGFVTSLHRGRDGAIWLGTARGLNRLTRTSTGALEIEVMPADEPIGGDHVSGIAEDEAGRLWLATNRGVTRFDPRSGERARFGNADGAQGNGYADGSFFRDDDTGLVYFGARGLTVFDPAEVTTNPYPPRVVATEIRVRHRTLLPIALDPESPLHAAAHATPRLELSAREATLAIEFAALHYADPRRNRYAFRLVGIDPEWIETDAKSRVAAYTQMPAGSYQLLVKASNKDGVWSEEVPLVQVRVLPPWYLSLWAVAAYGALVIGSIFALQWVLKRRWLVRQALLEKAALEEAILTDPLTQLRNRRYFDERVRPMLESALAAPPEQPNGEYVLVLLDLDRFKDINDEYGHGAGDLVLAQLAQRLREVCRDGDVVLRWGGDEFLVVGRMSQSDDAAVLAERFRAVVAASPVSLAGHGEARLTASLGFTHCPLPQPRAGAAETEAETVDAVVALADRALYTAKRTGKNRSVALP